ncbi:ATP-binding cassette sub-family A member 7 [Operophtera brumata]|uniref:ATP-binding cassette sub-family A member 7 n=1 Tax=Operophtera brumata TaxID=104452 RepID=A0A0L7LBI1_OPEBR|nr:ATP-binding cassette sub-family A member 7 [Operophtera brumata]
MTQCEMQTMCELYPTSCCVRENSHFEWEEPGILRYLVLMLISCAIFWTVLMLIEYRLLNRSPPPVDASRVDADVADEERHVARVDKSSLAQHGLVARGLSKYYGKHLAVDQERHVARVDKLSLAQHGLVARGLSKYYGKHLAVDQVSFRYCPQFDALFNELTGRETLRLFSLLRGLRAGATDLQATTLATSLGFLKHLDKRVWRAVRSVQKSGRGVVLTSHSMEECEALCSRLTIMVNGRFQCLGTPQHLKNKFSEGYTLTIKLKLDDHARNSTIGSVTDTVKHFGRISRSANVLLARSQHALVQNVRHYGASEARPRRRILQYLADNLRTNILAIHQIPKRRVGGLMELWANQLQRYRSQFVFVVKEYLYGDCTTCTKILLSYDKQIISYRHVALSRAGPLAFYPFLAAVAAHMLSRIRAHRIKMQVLCVNWNIYQRGVQVGNVLMITQCEQ